MFGKLFQVPFLERPLAKRLKAELEKDVVEVAAGMGAVMPSTNPVVVRPNENVISAHIVEQMKGFAHNNGLQVYTNKSSITNCGVTFSKYSTSQPDITVFQDNFIVVATADHTTMLCVQHEGEDDSGNVECIRKKVHGITLTGETKPDKGEQTDASTLGQLLAGMDKTLGDMFSKALYEQEALLTHVTMYGMCLKPAIDFCVVIRADVVIGKKTQIYMGNNKLSIADAVNRVFNQLVPRHCH